MSKATDQRKLAERIVVQSLESLKQAGVMQLPKAKKAAIHPHPSPLPEGEGVGTAEPQKEAQKLPAPGIVARSLFDAATAEKTVAPENRAAALETIRCEVAACTRCKVLADSRTQTVFGVGNPNAKICFFGEAPGADEDRLGEPFVGRGGQLLNKMLAACGLKREDVYIMNVLKCRPPENRNPLPDEVTNCRGYFERQLEIIHPEIICCLGSVASKTLLNTETGIGKLRGKIHDYHGISVVCTYHPAYLLRNPPAKADAWEDLKLLMRQQGVEL